MSRTLDQIFIANPITTNNSTDLMYFSRSPYSTGNDAGMTFANFAAQFASAITPSALTASPDTNVTITLGGTPSTALLQATSITLGWTGQLSPARGGTGVNNGSNTLTLAGSLATVGAFGVTFNFTAATNVTFPTSGTLATTGQLPTPAALTATPDTNVTITLGGTPAIALLQATSITLGWTGQLSLARGGTNASLTASNGGIFYSTASAGAILAGTATANQVLLSGATAPPIWSTATYPASTSINQILYSSATNVIAGITTLNNGVLLTSTTGVPTWLANSATPGFVLTANSGAPASWQTVSASGAITGINGTTNEVIVSGPVSGVVTLSLPQAIATTSNVTFGSLTFTTLQCNINGGQLLDNLGGPCIAFNDPGSLASNFMRFFGGVTGTGPHMQAFGSDPNVTGNLLALGTGGWNIQGVSTNGLAPAGQVGELIQSVIPSASAVTFTSSTPANLTSISLTAGDWDVFGNITFSGTTITTAQIWISTTSATIPDDSLISIINSTVSNPFIGLPAPSIPLSLPSTTTVYISGSVAGTGTLKGMGGIYARRRR